MVCALVVGVGGLPALASGRQAAPRPADARVIAFDYGFHEAGQPNDDNVVHVPAGGTVEFSYPEGQNEHNVDFGQDVTTCQMTAAPPGEPLEEGPPLPGPHDPQEARGPPGRAARGGATAALARRAAGVGGHLPVQLARDVPVL